MLMVHAIYSYQKDITWATHHMFMTCMLTYSTDRIRVTDINGGQHTFIGISTQLHPVVSALTVRNQRADFARSTESLHDNWCYDDNVNELSSRCQCIVNAMSLRCQWTINSKSMDYHRSCVVHSIVSCTVHPNFQKM